MKFVRGSGAKTMESNMVQQFIEHFHLYPNAGLVDVFLFAVIYIYSWICFLIEKNGMLRKKSSFKWQNRCN